MRARIREQVLAAAAELDAAEREPRIDVRDAAGRYMPTAEHGTRPRYAGGCRCDECREANTVATRRYRATGSVRKAAA